MADPAAAGAAAPDASAPKRTPAAGPPGHVAGVARGGAANLVGAVVYGASGFVLLVVLNRVLGVRDAGVVVVAIAIFNILTVIGGLGTSTGLVRTIARLRATGHPEEVPAMVRVALVPVAVVSLAATAGLWAAAPWLAELFADGPRVDEVASVLRAMAPFVPFATMHTVVVQATRGFDTMVPQVVIEKIGRSLATPILAGTAAVLGAGPRGVGVAWAASNVVALVLSWRALSSRVRAAVAAAERPAAPITRQARKEFWAFTGPRGVAQAAIVAVNWFDTILVGAILSTSAAAIYASGTRYLLPGIFAADALVQVTSPRLSGLLSTGRKAEASELVQAVGGWQVAVMWPTYLLIALFPTPLLRLFGPEVVAARGALVALAVAMLVTSPLGPSGAVILMAGRSRQAMFNTLIVLTVNIVGNLLFTERYGITAAGVVWGVTILTTEGLTGWQANLSLGVRTIGRPALTAIAVSAATVGVVGAGCRLLLGDDLLGLLVAGTLGGTSYLVGLRIFRSSMHLDAWWSGIRGRSVTVAAPAAGPARGTP
ncbi:MAG: polysaccharide biosynthesis protein [Actinobacteria bacterium]|nr:polysaccharide biosynthesis protein [Actinomycetota bacterium]